MTITDNWLYVIAALVLAAAYLDIRFMLMRIKRQLGENGTASAPLAPAVFLNGNGELTPVVPIEGATATVVSDTGLHSTPALWPARRLGDPGYAASLVPPVLSKPVLIEPTEAVFDFTAFAVYSIERVANSHTLICYKDSDGDDNSEWQCVCSEENHQRLVASFLRHKSQA